MITKMWETINSFIPQFIHNRRQKMIYISATQRKMRQTPINQHMNSKFQNLESKQQKIDLQQKNKAQTAIINEQLIIIEESNQTQINNIATLGSKSIDNIQISTQNKNKGSNTKNSQKGTHEYNKGKKESTIDQLNQDMVFNFKQLQEALNKVDQAHQPIKQYNQSNLKVTVLQQRELLQRILRPSQASQQNLKNHAQNFIHQYNQTVENLRSLKYQSELINYPYIGFDQFQFIVGEIWQANKNKQNTKIQKNGKVNRFYLQYRDIAKLSPGSWLNDNITANYINLMNEQLQKRQSKFFILDSLFSANMFEKQKTQDLILRSLKRKNVTPQNILLVGINTGNHWFFVKINDSRIRIYDSMKNDAKFYAEKSKIIKNIIKFSNWFYSPNFQPKDRKFQIQVHQQFPQQSNGYDCGIFMCFGMKDVVRGIQKLWTFGQKDCNYKRIQLGWELINEKITGF